MLYQLYSFGRCGHHAVMNWICEQSRPSVFYSNCTVYKDDKVVKDGSLYEYPINSSEIKKYRAKDVKINTNRYKLIILNFINKDIDYISEHINHAKNIIVIRDPYNWIASRMKHGGGVRKKIDECVPIYKRYIKICLGDIKFPAIDINYNKWFVSKEYRKNITDRLNIDFTDKGLSYTNHKGRSKFQNDEDNGRKLGVLNRYKEIDIDHHIDKEMVQLSERYFGKIK